MATSTTSAQKIKAARLSLGMTLAELGRKCGWDRQRQWQIENDWRGSDADVETLRTVAKALRLKLSDLIE